MNFLISTYQVFSNPKFIQLLNNHQIRQVCYVASNFKMNEHNNRYSHYLKECFLNKAHIDVDVYIIDERMSKQEANKIISRSHCLFLAGGNTELQFKYLKMYDLVDLIKDFSKVVIGQSAGAMNLAENVIIPKGLDTYINEDIYYEGIGHVDFSVLPHYDTFTTDYIESLPEDIVYGIDDDGFIYINGNDIVLDKCHII